MIVRTQLFMDASAKGDLHLCAVNIINLCQLLNSLLLQNLQLMFQMCVAFSAFNV